MAESDQGTSTRTDDSGTRTVVVEKDETAESPPVLQLRLQQPKNEHKVKWTSDTVDNEFMGKKKSKCCCIYEKPKVFGESDSSSSSDENDEGCTPHCRGHKKKCYRHEAHHHDHDHNHDHGHDGPQDDGAGPSNAESTESSEREDVCWRDGGGKDSPCCQK